MIFRHGTRNPTLEDIHDIEALSEFFQTNPDIVENLINEDSKFFWLKEWRNPFSFETAGHLHTNGMEDLYRIGKRLRLGDLGTLVEERGYEPHRHKFSSSEVQRTIKSAQVFSTGFFFDDSKKDALGERLHISKSPKASDWVLRFFEACDSFRKEVKNDIHHAEMKLFLSTHINQHIASFLSRWNLLKSVEDGKTEILELQTSSPEDDQPKHPIQAHIRAMYRSCVFEASLNKTEDRFCRFFENELLEAFDYAKDLSFYWTRAHGNPFGTKLAVPLLQTVIANLESWISDSDQNLDVMASNEPNSLHFLFGHAETLMPLLSLFGLYDDKFHWRHDSPIESWRTRSFRSSEIMPFAANLGFLLYDCDEKPFVRVLHNEQEVTIPHCGSVMCPWQDFKSHLQYWMQEDVRAQCTL
jgi:multiple inositol-polyphosphate phosphatase/2,3-bisphosphoglycerate 3-phosphatase